MFEILLQACSPCISPGFVTHVSLTHPDRYKNIEPNGELAPAFEIEEHDRNTAVTGLAFFLEEQILNSAAGSWLCIKLPSCVLFVVHSWSSVVQHEGVGMLTSLPDTAHIGLFLDQSNESIDESRSDMSQGDCHLIWKWTRKETTRDAH